jgi:hypothetical protein
VIEQTPAQQLEHARKNHAAAARLARRIAEERRYRRSAKLDYEYATAVERTSRTLAALERLEATQPTDAGSRQDTIDISQAQDKAMAITATTNSRKLVPAGNYFAAVVGIYDIGTQPSDKFEPSHQIIVSFELHKKKGVCRDDENRPLLYNKYFSLKLGINKQTKQPSQLRQAVEALLGRSLTADEAKGYDVTKLLDTTCRMTVGHDEDGTTDLIKSYAPMDEDDPEISIETSGVVYELDPSKEIPAEVPEWICKTIQKAKEWTMEGRPATAKPPRVGSNGSAKSAAPDDETPF